MNFIDIHTHKADNDDNFSILNCEDYIAGRRISIGIHPWNIKNDWTTLFSKIELEAERENVRAIGECGIDKLKSMASVELQQEIFKAHAILAEKTQKPLIIHCVKAIDEIIATHREISPKQAWIIHGFRGKPQQAEQLIKEGFYISFGEKFNIDSLNSTPTDKLFIESDESCMDINCIYCMIAEARKCNVEDLAFATMQNARKCNIIP